MSEAIKISHEPANKKTPLEIYADTAQHVAYLQEKINRQRNAIYCLTSVVASFAILLITLLAIK